jgi:hypothetical protein
MGSERRASTRVSFSATVDLIFSDRTYEKSETQDLSTTGVLAIGADGKENEECEVILYLTGLTSDLCLRMKGKIVRVQPDGVAVNFFEIDIDSYYHLKNIVYYNSDNPDELVGELEDNLADDDFID